MKHPLIKLLPVLFGFFIMGFCDVVGIGTAYLQKDFGLDETTAGFVPSMVFIWFLFLSLPAALLMNRLGRKRTVVMSNIITTAGMLLPLLSYNLATCMAAFLLLGVGNTILQVSLNPLLTNVVKGNALASSLTAGQIIKALSSFCGPLLAAFAALYLGNWQYLFLIYAVLTVLSTLWLQMTRIKEEPYESRSSIVKSLSLLRQSRILLLFLGIFFICGADIGVNMVAPKLLIERCGHAVEDAGFGASLYFVCRTLGAFAGTIALARIAPVRYFRINIAAAIAALVMLFVADSVTSILVGVGMVGFFCASFFSIIFSLALEYDRKCENEMSGLMIMGIFGAAVLPPVMGFFADMFGNQGGSLLVIGFALLYLAYCSVMMGQPRKAEATQ